MRHKAKIDWWIALGVMVAIVVPAARGQYWIAGPPLVILLAFCLPQSYETTPEGLLIRAGLMRRLIRYEDIVFVGPGSKGGSSLALSFDRVKIQYAPAAELQIAPADPRAFFADLAARAPHLRRRGQDLVQALA